MIVLRLIGGIFMFVIGFAVGCIVAPFAGLAAMVNTRDEHGNSLDDNFVVTLLKLPFRLVYGIIATPFSFAIAAAAMAFGGSGSTTISIGSTPFTTKSVRGSTRDMFESGFATDKSNEVNSAPRQQASSTLNFRAKRSVDQADVAAPAIKATVRAG